jgi:hypothetical protein
MGRDWAAPCKKRLVQTTLFPFPVMFYYTPRNEVVGGYTGFTTSVRPSVCPSVRPSVDKSYVVR